jgi:hypothetical protein
MSKNHPHDNIYSILGKLEALQPTPQEHHDAKVQQIRESVESQGSILKGLRDVSSVEQRLARQFAESKTDEAVRVAGNTKGPVGHYSQMKYAKKDGSPEAQAHRDATAAMAKSARAAGSKLPFNKTTDPTGKLASGGYNAMTKGVTPIRTAEKVEEKAVSQAQQKFMGMVHAAQKGAKPASPEVAKVAKDMGKKDARDFAATKHKGLPQHVAEGHCSKCDCDPCECPTNESMCNECGMYESKCKCDHTNEGETKHKDGVTRHTKTDYPGYPSSDLEKDDDTDAPASKGGKGRPRKAQTKKPRPSGERAGIKGRPKKDAGEKSADNLPFSSKNKMGHDPFGRVKSGAEKKGSKIKGKKHTMSESIMESINFKRMMEEQHMTLDEMLECMNTDIAMFKESGVCSDRLRDMMEVYAHAKRQMEETIDPTNPRDYEIPTVMRKAAGQAPLTRQDIINKDRKPEFDYHQRAHGTPHPDSLDAELNELARLAGLKMADEGNAFTGKLKATPKGEKFDLDGKEYTDTSNLDEEPNEGNAFGAAVAKAKADGIQPGEKVTVGGKEYPVKEGTIEVDDAGANPVNKPKPKYGNIEQIKSQGDDLNRKKKQDPRTANRAANPLTNVPTLEARLAAEYESIKKSA